MTRRHPSVPFALPNRVYPKHGALYLVTPANQWLRLCAIKDGEAVMYAALSERVGQTSRGDMPAAIRAFKSAYLPTLAVSTRVDYDRMLDKIAEALQDFNAGTVGPADCQEVLDQWADKPTSAKHYRQLMSSFFKWCCAPKQRIRRDNPMRETETPTVPKRDVTWTPAQYWAVHAKLSPMVQVYHELSILLYQRTTDVRYIERAQLQPDTIDFQPTKTVRSSGARVRIPRTPEINACLARAEAIALELARKRAGSDSVAILRLPPHVIHQADGTPYTASGIRSAYRRAMAECGVAGVTPKDLRATAATWADAEGYTLQELKVGLAHTTISTTEGYVKGRAAPTSAVRMRLPAKN